MSWAKIDDQLHANEKFAAVSLSAVGLWTLCLSWAADRRSDGRLPVAIVRRLGGHDTEPLASELVAAGLWNPLEGGWEIHNFLHYNPSRAEQEANDDHLSTVRSDAGRRGAEARWRTRSVEGSDGKNGKIIANGWQNDSKAQASTLATDWQDNAPDPVPVPISRPPKTSSSGAKGQNPYPENWHDAETLSPGALLRRYRESFGPEGEERLTSWLAAARKPVQVQAAYLRPCILGWLRGEEPDPLESPTPALTEQHPAPTRSINAAAAARAEALRAEHGTVAAILNPTPEARS